MAIRPILEFPDTRLRTIAKPVPVIDASIQVLVDDMFETMYDAGGIGLAATQVDVHLRVIVIDLRDEEHAPLVLINPEFETLTDQTDDMVEEEVEGDGAQKHVKTNATPAQQVVRSGAETGAWGRQLVELQRAQLVRHLQLVAR